jgi:hypothetical protein
MSQVNWTRQLGLAVVLIILGGVAYWVEFKQKPKEEAAEEQSKRIVTLKDVQIQSIRLEDQTRGFEFNCVDYEQKLCKPGDNSKWQMSEPRKIKADDSNVNALVSAVNNLAVTDSVNLAEESPEKRAALLKDYGLDADTRQKSRRKLTLRTPGNEKEKETLIELGAVHPIGESIFALANGNENKVYLLPNYFKTNFEHDLTYWRDKKLLALATNEVSKFKLEASKGLVEGERKDGQWTLRANQEELPGDIENIDNLLSGATYLTAKDFAAESKDDAKGKAALAGAKKLTALTLEKEQPKDSKTSSKTVLTLYKKGDDKTGKLFATLSTSDPVYEIELSQKDRFDKSLKDLRLQKLVTSMERFSAKKIELSGGSLAAPLVLTQKESKWSVGEKAANNDKVQQLLDRLTGNRIKEFLSGSAIPAGENKGTTLSLSDDKGQEKRKLVFWKSGDKLYARDLLSKRKEALAVDNAIEEALPKDAGHFDLKPAPSASPSE